MRSSALDLTSAEVASARLGISRASLYAYVSRGLIRSFTSPHDPRQRLYALDDVEALVERKARFRRPAAAAATALDWGLPVLETRITQIKDGRLFYRGADALTLAETAGIEAVACLLVGGMEAEAFDAPSPPTGSPESPALGPRAYVARAIRLLSEHGEETGHTACDVVSILRLMVMAGSGSHPRARPFHRHLAGAWNAEEAGEAIRRALVLCADHELSASAFAVRVAASTGATLGNAVIAGLAALSGPLHGGATERVRALLEDHEAEGGVERLAARLEASEEIPGFHHPLYPDGDPRGAAIVEGLPLLACDAAALSAIAEAGAGHASVDVGLVAMERAFRLPRGAAFALFASGRSAGWLAHAVEQRSQGSLIRPRARYVVAEEAPHEP
ncbi:citrate synthase [Microvirga roseola]|uniref:citrate synthase n=1 Tax=Microvirga roseola TaxID=2883126 RepID=UPI001E29D613|nr:citrate synthase [Microvirga roseola]